MPDKPIHTISATEQARCVGDVLARVRYRQEAFVVERSGRAVTHIVPLRAEATDATLYANDIDH